MKKDKHTQHRSVNITRRKSKQRKNDEQKHETLKFMQNMFGFYCERKESIVFDVQLIGMYLGKFDRKQPIVTSKAVLFSRIGLLFENVKQIGIYALSAECVMDLDEVLNEIASENCSHFERIQIRCNHSDSWLARAWSDSVKRKYNKKKW